jgi:hypothetical protein
MQYVLRCTGNKNYTASHPGRPQYTDYGLGVIYENNYHLLVAEWKGCHKNAGFTCTLAKLQSVHTNLCEQSPCCVTRTAGRIETFLSKGTAILMKLRGVMTGSSGGGWERGVCVCVCVCVCVTEQALLSGSCSKWDGELHLVRCCIQFEPQPEWRGY